VIINPDVVYTPNLNQQNTTNVDIISTSAKKSLPSNDIDFYEHLHKYQSKIGEMGEQYVLNIEKNKLKNTEYINRIRQVSQDDNSAGYDILSYELDGTELYIEVKTTDKNYDSFFITQNELDKSIAYESAGKKCIIYRVINILSNPSHSIIENITKEFMLQPVVWKATKMTNNCSEYEESH
jgi:hypothetical protein